VHVYVVLLHHDTRYSIRGEGTVNDAGPKGATAIADALKLNTAVTNVDLSREMRMTAGCHSRCILW
jgi:hypothetical protein